VRIGDPAALPALRAAASSGDADERQGGLVALSRLGGEAERGLVSAARARDCGAGCPPARQRTFDGMAARLDAAKACGSAARCWASKLADPSAAVRDRAALEVGRAGGAVGTAEVEALAAAVIQAVDDDADLAARYHAVLALGWLARRGDLGAAGASAAEQIERMIAQERGRSLTAGVNEDALRLATRLRAPAPAHAAAR
jgi:hypothetical protein